MAYAEISVFITQEEYNANGYSAQELVASELRNRLANTDLGYNVVEPNDTPDMGTQDAGCGDGGLLKDWRNMLNNCLVSPCSSDAHLLITNSTTTEGCADTPGKACVAGGGPHLASASNLSQYGPRDSSYAAFNVCAQEIFHNLNVAHKHGDNNYSNGWYVSPMMTGYKNALCGDYNYCNDLIACDNIDGYDTQWTECAENKAESYLS